MVRRENHRERLPCPLLGNLASTAHCASRASHPLTTRHALQSLHSNATLRLSAVRSGGWSVKHQGVALHCARHSPCAQRRLYLLGSEDQDRALRGVHAPRRVAGRLFGWLRYYARSKTESRASPEHLAILLSPASLSGQSAHPQICHLQSALRLSANSTPLVIQMRLTERSPLHDQLSLAQCSRNSVMTNRRAMNRYRH